jgi:hypothetical protein
METIEADTLALPGDLATPNKPTRQRIVLAGLCVGMVVGLVLTLRSIPTRTLPGAAPQNGYDTRQVSYDPVAHPLAIPVLIPDFKLGQPPMKLAEETLPDEIHNGQALSYRGALQLPADDSVVGNVVVEWYGHDRNGKELINLLEIVVPVRAEPGTWTYHADQKIRATPDSYRVRLVFIELKKSIGKRHIIGEWSAPRMVIPNPGEPSVVPK